jgi:hypothetical protein
MIASAATPIFRVTAQLPLDSLAKQWIQRSRRDGSGTSRM